MTTGDWKDGYLQARLRDVPFFVEVATCEGGRRLVAHTYPGEDGAEYEDQGAIENNLPLECYLAASDYDKKRKTFEAALSQKGPALMVHPYRGTINVLIGKWKGDERANEAGMIRYSVEVFRADDVSPKKPDVNTAQTVYQIKEEVLAQTKSNFVDTYSFLDRLYSAVTDAQYVLNSGLDKIKEAKKIAAAGQFFQQSIERAQGQLGALTLNAEYIADTFISLINYGADPETYKTFGATAANSLGQLAETRQLFDFFKKPSAPSSEIITDSIDYPSRQIEVLGMTACAAAEAGLVVSAAFTSVEQIQEVQQLVFRDIDFVRSLEGIPDDLYAVLSDLKAALFEHIQSAVMALPFLVQYNPTTEHSTVELLYTVYGDLELEEDFLNRNDHIIHPGFIPASVPLQMLVRYE